MTLDREEASERLAHLAVVVDDEEARLHGAVILTTPVESCLRTLAKCLTKRVTTRSRRPAGRADEVNCPM
jgi:hypothetical protein